MPKFLDGYYTLQAGPQALQTAALVRHQDRELFAQTIHKGINSARGGPIPPQKLRA